jgi:uncharacterized protein YbjT (DUF2867 family)
MLAKMARRPALILPGDVHMQPVDSDEFADVVLAALVDEHRGEFDDLSGPETLTMRELAEQYLAAHDLRRSVWNAPLPGRVKTALESGNMSAHARRGTTTWADWLGHSRAAIETAARLAAQPARM